MLTIFRVQPSFSLLPEGCILLHGRRSKAPHLPPSTLPRMLNLDCMDAAQYPYQPKQCVNVSWYVTSTDGVFLDAISADG